MMQKKQMNNPYQEERELLAEALKLRKEYEEFEEWCTEHNPDAWKPFPEWINDYYVQLAANSEV